MKISDFVNALADNPESNIVHEVPGCDHDWQIILETRGSENWEAQRNEAGVMKAVFLYSNGDETTGISEILCRDCGTEPDADEWGEIVRAIGIEH